MRGGAFTRAAGHRVVRVLPPHGERPRGNGEDHQSLRRPLRRGPGRDTRPGPRVRRLQRHSHRLRHPVLLLGRRRLRRRAAGLPQPQPRFRSGDAADAQDRHRGGRGRSPRLPRKGRRTVTTAAPPAPPAQGYQGTEKLLWGIVLAVLTFWLFAGTAGTVAPAILREINSTQQYVDAASMNLAVSITALFSGLFIVMMGGFADKLGRVKITLLGVVLGSIGSLLLVFAIGSVALP